MNQFVNFGHDPGTRARVSDVSAVEHPKNNRKVHRSAGIFFRVSTVTTHESQTFLISYPAKNIRLNTNSSVSKRKVAQNSYFFTLL